MSNPPRPASLPAVINAGRTGLPKDIARRRADINTGPTRKAETPAAGPNGITTIISSQTITAGGGWTTLTSFGDTANVGSAVTRSGNVYTVADDGVYLLSMAGSFNVVGVVDGGIRMATSAFIGTPVPSDFCSAADTLPGGVNNQVLSLTRVVYLTASSTVTATVILGGVTNYQFLGYMSVMQLTTT